MSDIKHWLFLVVLILAGCGDPKSDTTDAIATDPNARLLVLEQEIIASPRDASLFAERARLNESRDSLQLALNDWNRAITLDSTKSEYQLGIGDLYYLKVRLPEAEKHFRKAAALDPKATEPRLKLAEMKLLQREYNEAMGWANDALRIDQQHARGYFLKGWIHMEAGDTALAISSYRTAVEQDPSMDEAFVQLGVLHAAVHDPLAMQYYNSALEIAPGNTKALYGLAMFAQEHGMDSLALKVYGRMKELLPDDPLPWYNTGYVLLEHAQRPGPARTEFTKAVKLAPGFAEAWYNRGLTYELEGRLDSAYKDYRRALALRPDYTPAAESISRLRAKGLRIEP